MSVMSKGLTSAASESTILKNCTPQNAYIWGSGNHTSQNEKEKKITPIKIIREKRLTGMAPMDMIKYLKS